MRIDSNICISHTCRQENKMSIPNSEYIAPIQMCVQCFTQYQILQSQMIQQMQERMIQMESELYNKSVHVKKNVEKSEVIITGDDVIKANSTIQVWKDTETGLYWEVKQLSNIDKTFTYQEALECPNELNKKKWGGFDDWALPSRAKLKTIITKNKNNNNYIKKALSENLGIHSCGWSCEKKDCTYAFFVFFCSGNVFSHHMEDISHVRCVRGSL